MTIRILPAITVNRIAAGEVIERPSSALKELVENSIDSGANNISITIRSGGKNLISVTDNGCGMNKDELELAITRHATSKLPDDDLLNIAYFGFRGEALPSIASIGRLSITSRKDGAESAWTLKIDGGEKLDLIPASLNKGTKIELRDLFFATPARLKFLKTERTEQQHAIDIINRLAMAHPNVAFTMKADDKAVINFPANQGNLLDARLIRLDTVMGKNFAKNSVIVEGEQEDIRISGYASIPTFNRRTSAGQYLFINNRPVRDKLLFGATRAAYQDFLGNNSYPVLALFIDIKPEMVDVNVHPAKTEVRFRDSGVIRGMVVSALKNALAGAGFRASTTISDAALGSFSTPPITGSKQYYSSQPNTSYFGSKARSVTLPMFAENPPLAQVLKEEGKAEAETIAFPLGAARCQLHETYIISQTEDSIIIVDQHAAHERLVYEKMKTMLAKGGVTTQKLLIPEIVDMDETSILHIMEKREELSKAGLVIEKFGEKAIIVREVPAIIGDANIKKLLKNIADDILESGETLSLSKAFEYIIETIACHGSIRSGRKLNAAEMNQILRDMEKTPHSGQCNHGRPTYIELKLDKVEKLFGRS